MGATHFNNLPLRLTIIAGGAAGDHTVTGITTKDSLLYVGHLTTSAEGTYGFAVDGFADLTSEFSISAANTINNTGGTATANDHLFVIWLEASDYA